MHAADSSREAEAGGFARLFDGGGSAEGNLAATDASGRLHYVCPPPLVDAGNGNRYEPGLAAVVCRQLGFAGGSAAVAPPRMFHYRKIDAYGSGWGSTGSIGFRCQGNETGLADCAQLNKSCWIGNYQPVGIVCNASSEGTIVRFQKPDRWVPSMVKKGAQSVDQVSDWSGMLCIETSTGLQHPIV